MRKSVAKAVPKNIEDALIARGRWGDFVRTLEGRRVNGRRLANVVQDVLGEIAPDLVSVMGVDMKPAPRARIVDGSGGECEMDVPEKVSARFFNDRACSDAESVRWAVMMSEVNGVTPDMCPSLMAWTFYLNMKRSPSLAADIMKSFASKALAKIDDDNRSRDDAIDGQKEYDLLKAIAEGRE